jgi:hypothetical protein
MILYCKKKCKKRVNISSAGFAGLCFQFYCMNRFKNPFITKIRARAAAIIAIIIGRLHCKMPRVEQSRCRFCWANGQNCQKI